MAKPHFTERLLLQIAGGQTSGATGQEFHCSVCNQSLQSASNLQQHSNSARHRVNLLAQQLSSSGSFHANLQGLQVSEFEEVAGLEVSNAECIVMNQLGAGLCQVRSLVWAIYS
jgi:hypothetical protein